MKRTTPIRVKGQTWRVPRGFGAVYLRVVKADLELIGRGKPGAVLHGIIDVLALIGYAATPEQVADWDLRKRVEANVYAATEHARAGDNHVRRHPRPRWLPAHPWQGGLVTASPGVFSGPAGTPIKERAK